MPNETTPVLLDPLPKIFPVCSLNLLAGASGIGKTALISWLAKQFRDGADIFGHSTNTPPAIGYVTADRPWRGTKHWWEAVGFADIRHYSLIDDHALELAGLKNRHNRVEFLKKCVAKLELPPGSLLIVDPIALFLGGNLIDYDTVAVACMQIQRWLQLPAQQHCVIGICHTAKQKADKGDRYLRMQDRILGSGALLGYTGTQMYLAAPEETGNEDGRYTFLWNPHEAKAEIFFLDKDPNTGLFNTAGHKAPDAIIDLSEPVLTAIELTILGLFSEPGAVVSTFQIITADLASRSSAFRAIEHLCELEYLLKIKHGVYARTEKKYGPHPPGETPSIPSDLP